MAEVSFRPPSHLGQVVVSPAVYKEATPLNETTPPTSAQFLKLFDESAPSTGSTDELEADPYFELAELAPPRSSCFLLPNQYSLNELYQQTFSTDVDIREAAFKDLSFHGLVGAEIIASRLTDESQSVRLSASTLLLNLNLFSPEIEIGLVRAAIASDGWEERFHGEVFRQLKTRGVQTTDWTLASKALCLLDEYRTNRFDFSTYLPDFLYFRFVISNCDQAIVTDQYFDGPRPDKLQRAAIEITKLLMVRPDLAQAFGVWPKASYCPVFEPSTYTSLNEISLLDPLNREHNVYAPLVAILRGHSKATSALIRALQQVASSDSIRTPKYDKVGSEY